MRQTRLSFYWRRVVPLRLERHAERRAQHASACKVYECLFQDRNILCPGRDKEATRRILCRQAQVFQHTATPGRYRFPAWSVECFAKNSVRNDNELQGYSSKHRQAPSRKSRCRSHRGKRHQHPHPLPSRHRLQQFLDWLCRRIGGKESFAWDRDTK